MLLICSLTHDHECTFLLAISGEGGTRSLARRNARTESHVAMDADNGWEEAWSERMHARESHPQQQEQEGEASEEVTRVTQEGVS